MAPGNLAMSCRRMIALALLGLALLATGARAQPCPPDPPLLGLPTYGFNPCSVPTGNYVFTSEAQWLAFWRSGSALPAPRVDFTRWQIVAVALGPRPNAGYAVHFVDYCREGETIVARYEEWLPGPGGVWEAAPTYPFDIVAVPAGGALRFERVWGPHQGVTTPAPRRVPTQRVMLAALSPCTPEQFVAFPTQESWNQFWCAYGQGPAPQVHFGRGYTAVGVLGLPPEEGMTVSEVTRAGDRITVTVGPCDAGCSGGRDERSMLLVVPPAHRVDFRWLPFCK